MKFKNKHGHIEHSSVPFLWCFLFGSFYFIYKGIWRHAIISFILTIATVGISWIVYPFIASNILENNYLKNGWKPVGLRKIQEPENDINWMGMSIIISIIGSIFLFLFFR